MRWAALEGVRRGKFGKAAWGSDDNDDGNTAGPGTCSSLPVVRALKADSSGDGGGAVQVESS